jgi:Pyruvate/2-oxoacid:ferredoxin oxidoreductase delta subunit
MLEVDMTTEDAYRRLAEHLDRLPDGFAPSESGADLRLLKRLFTPEEAELATHLSLDQEEARVIAERAGLPLTETEQLLREMARKGLIFSLEPEDGRALYQALPWVVGVLEFQVGNLYDEDLFRALGDYSSSREERPEAETIPQVRTIPVNEAIEYRPEALPYEQIHELVNAYDRFAVAPCICRRGAMLRGGGCDAPAETCLWFGDWADYCVRGGWGRRLNRAEVMEIIAKADEANLVLQPSNSRDISFLCCCCGCCCSVLGGLKRHPRPADVAASAFIAQSDPDTCAGCWTCLDRCQMGAVAEDGDRVALDTARCIGCGLCVSTCPTGSLTLVRKPESERTRVPVSMDATWRKISQAQMMQRQESPQT